MKLTLLGAALAAASLAHAGAGDYLGAEPRQLGRRLAADDAGEVNDTGPVLQQQNQHHEPLEARAALGQAEAKAHAAVARAAKVKAAAAGKAKSAASVAVAVAKSKAAAS